jgi:hypothetical protein
MFRLGQEKKLRRDRLKWACLHGLRVEIRMATRVGYGGDVVGALQTLPDTCIWQNGGAVAGGSWVAVAASSGR